jgi:hypothetical protein
MVIRTTRLTSVEHAAGDESRLRARGRVARRSQPVSYKEVTALKFSDELTSGGSPRPRRPSASHALSMRFGLQALDDILNVARVTFNAY